MYSNISATHFNSSYLKRAHGNPGDGWVSFSFFPRRNLIFRFLSFWPHAFGRSFVRSPVRSQLVPMLGIIPSRLNLQAVKEDEVMTSRRRGYTWAAS
jgi:hypothetical protein